MSTLNATDLFAVRRGSQTYKVSYQDVLAGVVLPSVLTYMGATNPAAAAPAPAGGLKAGMTYVLTPAGKLAVSWTGIAGIDATDGQLAIWEGTKWELIGNTGAIPHATETVVGIVELATAAETTTGTDATRAVHPAGLKVELDKKAPLASPALTGAPTAPTAAAGTNTTQLATTAFVHAATPNASATVPGLAQLADAAAITAGTAGRVVDAAQLKAAQAAQAGSTTAPATPTTGQVWINNSVTPAVTNVWNGTAWVPQVGATISSATAPAAPATGQVWVNTSVTPNVTSIWDGTAWVAAKPDGAAVAAIANDAKYATKAELATENLWDKTGTTLSPATAGDLVAVAALPTATETAAGIVELATAAETTTGTDATRAVHPAGLTAALTFTQAGTGAKPRSYDSKLKDVVSVKDFGAVGDGVTDDTAAIQAAINYALSLAAYFSPYTPTVTVTVQFPAAIYKVAGNLSVPTPPTVLSLEAIGRATLLHTGTGACLTVGNGSSHGIMPMRIKGLHFRRTASIAGSVGLLVDICSNGVYEDLGFDNFETAVKALGAINCIFDFKRHGILGAQTGILLETKAGSGGGLRLDANLTLIQNAMFQGSCVNGIIIKTGAGATPIGSGGCIRIDKCTFEGVTGKSIQVENYGEAAGIGDELLVTDCWFEGYGTTIAEIANSKMKFSHCFIGNGSANMFRLMDNYSGVVIDACTGYFLDNPATNGLVTLGGTATTAALKNVALDRGGFQGLTKLHNTYPVTTLGVVTVPVKTFAIRYNATYPVGNIDRNWGLALVMDTEISKFIGPNWAMARVWFSGNDGSTSSALLIDAVKTETGLVTLTAVTTPPAYTITNNGTTTATLTFNNDGTGRWFNMRALYQITDFTAP